MDRLQGILVSAMLQSQQCHLPLLHEPTPFAKLLSNDSIPKDRYIAHCLQDGERKSFRQMVQSTESSIILIGPEGDFTSAEIQQSLLAGYTPVTLGEQRLRTETAGVVAAVLGLN